MSELPSNGDPNLPPNTTPTMIEEHYGGEDGEECGTCHENVDPCDIERICCTCSAYKQREIDHQQQHALWLLENQRKHAEAALDLLRTVVLPITLTNLYGPNPDWFQMRTVTQNAIKFLEFASGSKAPTTTAEDVLKGLRGQAAR